MAKKLKKTKKLNRSKKGQYIIVCPKCKSSDIKQDDSVLQQIGALPSMHLCNKCGYAGYVFPEVLVSKLDTFKEEVERNKKRFSGKGMIDPSYGDFQVRFVWKITAPLTIFIGILLLNRELYVALILIVIGSIASYITYFKKKGLKKE